jgi:hypothetical protein
MRLPQFYSMKPASSATSPNRSLAGERDAGIAPSTCGPCIGGKMECQDCDRHGNCTTKIVSCLGEGTWLMRHRTAWGARS